MLRGDMMREIKVSRFIYLVLAFVLLLNVSVFADMKVPDFNGVGPQSHINKIYSDSRKNELKSGDIKYEDIADMIHLYNPDVLNNWNSWENNRSSQDIYDDLVDAADRASGTDTGSDYMDAMGQSNADALRIQADKNISDSYVNFLTYYLDEMKLVNTTKIDDINYHKSNYDLMIAEENFAEAVRNEEKVKNSFNVGNATQIEYLTAKKNLVDANSSLVSARSAQNKYKRDLIVNCGRSMKDNVNILPVNIDCDNEINAIDFAGDYQKALTNSIQYEIYKKGKENAKTKEVQNEYQILIDAAPQKIYNDLESKYNDILDAIDSRNNRQVAYALAIDTLSNAKNNYTNGNISYKDYISAESSVNIAKYNLESSKYDVKIALEKYKASVDGFGEC